MLTRSNLTMRSMRKILAVAWPFVIIVFLQFGYAIMTVLAKVALDDGMNIFIFIVYRYAIASVALLPFALWKERNVRPRMTLPIFLKIMLLGLLEPVGDQALFYTGMKLTSATFASAMANILPALSFIMACLFSVVVNELNRLEKVNIRETRSQAKIVGTLISMAGAMVLTLCHGPTITMPWSRSSEQCLQEVPTSHEGSNLLEGSFFVIASCFCWTFFITLQAFVLRDYPAEMSLSALVCVMGTIQGSIAGLIGLHGVNGGWIIGFNKKLLVIIYAGIFCSGVSYYLQGLVIKKRGPILATSFAPLGMIIVAILGSLLLQEELYLGRVIGAVVVVVGLYSVVWGMVAKDETESLPEVANNDGRRPETKELELL